VTYGAALRVLAPAKINLYLHIVGKRADGYHLLDSLVVFADIGDVLTATPAEHLSLTIGGPEAAALATLGDDNLVLRAARLLAENAGVRAGACLHLDKHLPAASGIGGGSSDAAAALRLLNRLWQCRLDESALMALGVKLGADVPACIAARPVWVGGVGEEIEAAEGLPPACIALVNPRRQLATVDVFQARGGAFSSAGRFQPGLRDPTALAEALGGCRNDLTPPAQALMPEIAAALERLAALPGALMARMSGSGATCFALFGDRDTAVAAGQLFAAQWPGWWIAAGALPTAPPPIEELAAQPCR
jgi:4-diphosphocytidyl-2-C-methyl-D-erythritol kinase